MNINIINDDHVMVTLFLKFYCHFKCTSTTCRVST